MSRFDLERFDPAPDPDLVCCICTSVLFNPVETPCRHVFCKNCLNTWIVRKKTCPTCRHKITREENKPVLPLVQNLINKLSVKCQNDQSGCVEKISLECYDKHIKDCQYNKVTCQYSKCKKDILQKDHEQHKEHCEYKEVLCVKKCGLHVLVTELTSHNCMDAMKKKLADMENIVTLERELRSKVEELNAGLNQQLVLFEDQMNLLRRARSQPNSDDDNDSIVQLNHLNDDNRSVRSESSYLTIGDDASSATGFSSSTDSTNITGSGSSDDDSSDSDSHGDDNDNQRVTFYASDDEESSYEADSHQPSEKSSQQVEQNNQQPASTAAAANNNNDQSSSQSEESASDEIGNTGNNIQVVSVSDTLNTLQSQASDVIILNTDNNDNQSSNNGNDDAVDVEENIINVTDVVSSDESSGFGSLFHEDQNSSDGSVTVPQAQSSENVCNSSENICNSSENVCNSSENVCNTDNVSNRDTTNPNDVIASGNLPSLEVLNGEGSNKPNKVIKVAEHLNNTFSISSEEESNLSYSSVFENNTIHHHTTEYESGHEQVDAINSSYDYTNNDHVKLLPRNTSTQSVNDLNRKKDAVSGDNIVIPLDNIVKCKENVDLSHESFRSYSIRRRVSSTSSNAEEHDQEQHVEKCKKGKISGTLKRRKISTTTSDGSDDDSTALPLVPSKKSRNSALTQNHTQRDIDARNCTAITNNIPSDTNNNRKRSVGGARKYSVRFVSDNESPEKKEKSTDCLR